MEKEAEELKTVIRREIARLDFIPTPFSEYVGRLLFPGALAEWHPTKYFAGKVS
jgi:hypothetical protein